MASISTWPATRVVRCYTPTCPCPNEPDDFNVYFKNLLKVPWNKCMGYEDKLQTMQMLWAHNGKSCDADKAAETAP